MDCGRWIYKRRNFSFAGEYILAAEKHLNIAFFVRNIFHKVATAADFRPDFPSACWDWRSAAATIILEYLLKKLYVPGRV